MRKKSIKALQDTWDNNANDILLAYNNKDNKKSLMVLIEICEFVQFQLWITLYCVQI